MIWLDGRRGINEICHTVNIKFIKYVMIQQYIQTKNYAWNH